MNVNFGQVGTWLGDIANILKAVQDGIALKGAFASGKPFTPSFGS